MLNTKSSGGKRTLSSEAQVLVTSNLALVGYVVSGLAMKLPITLIATTFDLLALRV